MRVGVRGLPHHIIRYLDRVHEGTEAVVTEHGCAVARVVPLEGATPRSALDELLSEGLATPARRAARSLPGDLIRASPPVSPLVAEQRR